MSEAVCGSLGLACKGYALMSLAGGGQGHCQTSDSAQDSPTTGNSQPKRAVGLVLRKPGVSFLYLCD